MSSDHNPFAPPVTDEAPPAAPPPSADSALQDDEVRQALAHLERHVADPAALKADRRLEGRFRRLTAVLLGLTVLAIAASFTGWVLPILLAAGLFLALLVAANNDLRVRPRRRARTPAQAMQAIWRAVKLGRAGYFVASLCPTARQAELAPPPRAPRTGPAARFAMADPHQVARYLGRWAVSGFWRGRNMTVSYVKEQEQDGRAALVRSVVEIIAWPQWIAPTGLALLAGLIALAALLRSAALAVSSWVPVVVLVSVVYFVTRQVQEFRVDKILLRGGDGQWYQLRGDLER